MLHSGKDCSYSNFRAVCLLTKTVTLYLICLTGFWFDFYMLLKAADF